MLLALFPILFLVNIIYPAGKECDGEENCRMGFRDAFRKGMAISEFIDMAELMFGDLGCFQNYGTAWLTIFYLALAVSAFLMSFTAYGLEQEKTKKDGWLDYCVTGSNLVFNDILFLILRCKTMTTQNTLDIVELVFVIREAMSAIVRSVLLLTTCCEDEERPNIRYYSNFQNHDIESGL